MDKITANEDNGKLLSLIWNRAVISREGELIRDTKAEEIAERVDPAGQSLGGNKYLALFLGIRARVLDDIAEEFLEAHPDCTVLHLGCGLDSRCQRLKHRAAAWYDLDFPEVIELRREFYEETDSYHMIASDAADLKWLDAVPEADTGLIIAEGFSMFLTAEENIGLFAAFRKKFRYSEYAFDAYTDRAVLYAAGSGTPVRGKTVVWGLANPGLMEQIDGVRFLRAYNFHYSQYLRSFPLSTRLVYKLIYGKQSTSRLYRIYRYRISLEDSSL